MTTLREGLGVGEARQMILEEFGPLPPESVTLSQALGRVLAEAVRAEHDLPPFPNSAMDGYAVRAIDTEGARPEHPIHLRVIGEAAAGHPFSGAIEPGTTVRIATGALLPAGADAVVPVEDTNDRWGPGHPLPLMIAVFRAVRPGEFVRPAGEDVARGTIVLEPGTVLMPGALALLAALGRLEILVHRRPRVALLAIGDELIEPGQSLPPGCIYETNRTALAAQVLEAGGEPIVLGIARDDPEDLQRLLDEAAAHRSDLIVSSAGASVGAHDWVKEVVSRHGEIRLWKVRIRPGKPFAFGYYRGIPFFGLPGNPVSAMITFDQFVRPALRRMGGYPRWGRLRIPARLTEPVSSDGRETYFRARITYEDGQFQARLSGLQGSHNLSAMAWANGWVILAEGIRALPAGATIMAEVWTDLQDLIDTVEVSLSSYNP
ncbi:MAG: molybdopterin molybdotransferase MoeA [Anaerolineae bacterium]|nr:molybdopterin molybdotransferase MoeA [Thermoflexus sp.]MDW8065397.1 molybdopterin molybdotransferase MoeA [Anaerolineae bacterium]